MKQINFLKQVLMAALLFAVVKPASAQLSGTYTIGGTNPSYATLSAAISALNSSGVSGPVTFMIRDGSYSGTAWMGSITPITGASATNRVTFTSQSNDKTKVTITATTSSSANYVFQFDDASYVTVKNLTLKTSSSSYQNIFSYTSSASNDSVVNCSLSGIASSSSSGATALVYAYSFTGSNNVFKGNTFSEGGMWVYWYGSSTSSGPNNTLFADNTFTSTSGYYGIYSYYTSGLKLHNNVISRSGTGTYYTMYNYYPNDDYEIIGNTVTVNTTGTLYGIHGYYINGYSMNAVNTPKINNNVVNLTNTTGSTYPIYTYYGQYATYLNNVINATTTTGTIYGYGPLYYNSNSRASNNTLNYTMSEVSTSSYYLYNYYMCYNGNNADDTFTNNTINIYKANSGYLYNYVAYYGSTIIANNTYNIQGTTSTIYNYFYYLSGAKFTGNKFKSTTTTGTNYGIYNYSTTSYNGGFIDGNEFDISSNSGTVYGYYGNYLSGDKFMNNVVSTSTSGANYTMYLQYTYNCGVYNNTFHSNATGSTNYAAYVYNSSSSYNADVRNNIFSKSGTNGYGYYIYSPDYMSSDYNNVYVAGGTKFYNGYTGQTTNSLATWRAMTGLERNSVTYDPGYTNAASKDFRPNAANPNSWSVNGRGVHIDGDTMDVAGNPRPRVPADGVPDLGAYSFTPTALPPACVAAPSSPVANADQVFTFGEDTVAVISWGNTVPSNPLTIRQYTGTKANPINAGVERMFFYTSMDGNDVVYNSMPKVYYKNPWIGNISGEQNAVIAKSTAGNSWLGFNYNNAATDTARNILAPVQSFDSLGNYTGVENARIGVRCVPTPGAFKFSNITKQSADATWGSIWNPLGYQVVILDAPGNPSANGGTVVTSNNISFSGLQEDTKYWVYVRFICGAGDTSAWGVDTFWTLVDCHAPTLTLSQLNTDKVVVSWSNIKTSIGYEYVIDQSPNDPSFGTFIKNTSFLAPYLTSGINYYVHVRTKCNSIYTESPWATASFQTWPLGVGGVANAASGISAYPNPASDVLKVEVGGTIGKDAVLQLTDVTGKVVVLEAVNSNTTSLNISELPAGIYLLKYRDDSRTETVKVTKQ